MSEKFADIIEINDKIITITILLLFTQSDLVVGCYSDFWILFINKYFIVEPLESINELNSYFEYMMRRNGLLCGCRVPECIFKGIVIIVIIVIIILSPKWNNFPCNSHQYTPIFRNVADNTLRHLKSVYKSWMPSENISIGKLFISSCMLYNNLHFMFSFILRSSYTYTYIYL